MAGVPASKRAGGSAYVELSKKTSWIISPPPIQGGIPARMSALAHRKPMPVGPHILCPEATMTSAPSVCTSTGMCGTLWHASSMRSAPCSCASSATSGTGSTLPSVLLTCASDTSLVRGPTSERSCSMSRPPSSPNPTKRSLAPFLAATSCHGTRLLWCSATDRTTSSPSCKLASPHVYANKLMASLALRTNTISRSLGALMNRATFSRACSYMVVANALKWCTPRCTLLLHSR
mmetsp:Transcript_18993/g.61928  ORF Transcript_18993/g.61928 Transcript_18993/m.61928 type:complete len:234 (+) Transcript_18993:447-1148(+)